jgi:flavin reductase (DIM6/NTAB) family NADH-FMN oxidoreductase RutF
MRPSNSGEDSVDSASFRQTVAQFATGVTVIATERGGSVHAMTANSFTSLSLSPPLVLFCAGKQTKMSVRVREAERFAVNILARGQEDVSSYFAGAWRQPEPPPFSFETWAAVPRLAGCAGVLACDVHAVHEGGDHWIIIGRVVHVARPDPPVMPLVVCGGRYLGLEERTASLSA